MINIFEYQYGSNKGSAKAGTTFSSPLAYQGTNPYYTTASVDGEEVTAGTHYLAYTPVKPGTVRLIPAAGGPAQDLDVIDAFTGEVSIPEDGKVYYLYDNETVPVTAPQIKLNIKSLPITTTSRKLSAVWAFDALELAA